MYITSFQYLQFANGGGCPTTACPVQEYLLSRSDILNFIATDNKTDDSESRTKVVYKLNLDTEDIGNKFIEVYKEAQKICERCREQSHKKSK